MRAQCLTVSSNSLLDHRIRSNDYKRHEKVPGIETPVIHKEKDTLVTGQTDSISPTSRKFLSTFDETKIYQL